MTFDNIGFVNCIHICRRHDSAMYVYILKINSVVINNVHSSDPIRYCHMGGQKSLSMATHRYKPALWMQCTQTVLRMCWCPTFRNLFSCHVVPFSQLYVGVVEKADPAGGGNAIQQPVDIQTSPLWMKVDSFLHLMTVEIFRPENFYSVKKKPAQGAESAG